MATRTFIKQISICVLLFIAAFYDTHLHHTFTEPVNQWILQNLIAEHSQQSVWQSIYYTLMHSITVLGSKHFFGIVLLFIMGYLIYYRNWALVFYSLIAVIIAMGIAFALKHAIDSPRPLFPLENDSFPSGHTTRATLWCGIILLVVQLKNVILSCYIRWVLVAIPLLVGFSRLALGKHWLSDVVAAYGICVGVLLMVCFMANRN